MTPETKTETERERARLYDLYNYFAQHKMQAGLVLAGICLVAAGANNVEVKRDMSEAADLSTASETTNAAQFVLNKKFPSIDDTDAALDIARVNRESPQVIAAMSEADKAANNAFGAVLLAGCFVVGGIAGSLDDRRQNR